MVLSVFLALASALLEAERESYALYKDLKRDKGVLTIASDGATEGYKNSEWQDLIQFRLAEKANGSRRKPKIGYVY